MSGEKATPLIKRYVIQVNSGRPRLGIDLTLCPESFVPNACNKRIEFTSKIYAFEGGKWVYPGEKRKITFSFKEVSKERGVCMNFPKRDKSNTNPDLFFADDDDKMKDFDFDEDETDGDANKSCPTEIRVAGDNPVHSHHYKKATTKKAVTEAKVVVRCEDYGAFGVLQAIAPDCETIPPRENDAEPSVGIGPNDVKIPRDDNDNDIADRAFRHDKKRHGITAPPDEDDDDTPPAIDNHKGDGLTNYEEYRGFIVKPRARAGKLTKKMHLRTDINKKDIFIYDRDNLLTGFFYKSGLAIHFIPHPDYYNGNSTDRDIKALEQGANAVDAGTQVINFNWTSHSRAHIQEQHGIRLVNENLDGRYGVTFVERPIDMAHMERTPKYVNRVAIDRAACINPSLSPILRAHDRQLKSTIAHELGHSVGLQHHGDRAPPRDQPPHEHEIADFRFVDPTKYSTEYIGGVSSGDVNCVMRYDNTFELWCHDPGKRAPPQPARAHCVHVHYPYPDLPGVTFCSSPRGTGNNESRQQVRLRGGALQKYARADCAIFNDAAAGRGNCRGRIRVKD